MARTITINYCPFEKQRLFHESNAKFRAIITGVGFGKSACGVNELLKQALKHANTLNLIFAPTFPMLKNTTMREFFKFCPVELIKDHNRTEHLITLVNGAQIIYLSGDNERDIDRLRGLTLACAYGDEVSLCPRYVHDIITARLRDNKGALKVFYTTTPRGFTWLYELFFQKKGVKNPEDYALFGGTSLDNPYTPQEYKDTLLNTYTDSFAKQEIYGEFVGFEGLVYPEFSRNVHITNAPFETLNIKHWIAGIDWGYTNPSVILVIGIDGDDRIYVIEELYEKHLDHEALKEAMKNLQVKYNVKNAYCDPSEPMFIESFKRAGINALPAKNDVMPGIKNVAQRLQVQNDGKPRLFVHERCVNLINEFQMYRYPDKKEGKPVMEEPVKLFDHALDALRYALMSLYAPRPTYAIV